MKKIYTLFSAAILISSMAFATNYPGNGKSGFGGPVGPGSLDVTSDGTNITFTLNRAGTQALNNPLVIYIDVDGITTGFASTSGFLDLTTELRSAISGYSGTTQRATFNFNADFKPEYALAFLAGGTAGAGELVLLDNTSHVSISSPTVVNGNNQSASSFSVTIAASDIGLSTAIKFNFIASYISGTGYRSDEAIGDPMTGFTQGWNPYTSTTSPLVYDATLPVVFGNFSGALKGSSVQLNWNTKTEINTKDYQVQKSVNGTSYTTIATVAASNNINGSSYSFMDNGNISSKNYYRIMSVDYDGKTAYTNAIIIRKDINTIIDVLGNPVKSTINLNISNKDAATYQLVLYSLNGIKLGSMMYNHSGGTGFVTMPVPANAKGQCILQIINGNEKQMVKVVVE